MKNLIEVQPKRNSFSSVRAEGVGVVEGQALGLDVAVAGAERHARVAVGQGRGQVAVGLLVAVADEEPVVGAQVVVDLDVDLVVLRARGSG